MPNINTFKTKRHRNLFSHVLEFATASTPRMLMWFPIDGVRITFYVPFGDANNDIRIYLMHHID